MSGMRSGIQYSARRVLAAHRVGQGVVLTVSTDDPSGRTLRVAITAAGNGLIRVSVTPHPATGVADDERLIRLAPDEAFHGFGGRHNALDQHGRALSSFVNKENLPGLGTPGTPAGVLFPNGPAATFYPQAQFISSRGYGFLLAQPQLAWFRLDSDRPRAWSVAASARSLSYVVAPGRPKQAITDLTGLTGRQPAPPAWALGPMLDRLVKNIGETQADYEANLNQDIANIDRYHLPLTGYRIEGWGFRDPANDGLVLYSPRVLSFATQSKIIAELQARHIHPLGYLRPFIAPGSAPDRQGLTIHRADGQTYTTSGTLGQHIAELDFTNPAAVRFWGREVAKMLDLGFDGFLADFGEEVLFDMHFADGETGQTMHNRNPILYMKATRQAIDAYERSHPSAEAVVLLRRRLLRHSRICGVRGREHRRRRGDQLGSGLGAGLAGAGHAEPGDRRRLRLHHGHRRLLRRDHAPDHQGAVPALGRVDGAQPDLPAARLRARGHPHAVVVRPADREASTAHCRFCTSRPRR